MPGDLSIGGGVYIYIPTISDIYWPVAGVMKPQHLWPFSQTGDYTDHGSTGGLDFTAQGSGNSFNANGLNFNGNGYAQLGSHNTDVNNLGNTFSVLFEYYSAGAFGGFGDYNNDGVNGSWSFPYLASAKLYGYTVDTTERAMTSGASITYSALHQVVVTYSPSGCVFYIDSNSSATGAGNFPPTEKADILLTIGAFRGGGSKMGNGSYIKRAGILKGTAWSADDVSAIYAALP